MTFQNAYEKTRVPDDLFPTLLRYMDSIKGGMRGLALDIAKKKLEKADKEDEDEPVELDEEVVRKIHFIFTFVTLPGHKALKEKSSRERGN